jgi:hypothetical protein
MILLYHPWVYEIDIVEYALQVPLRQKPWSITTFLISYDTIIRHSFTGHHSRHLTLNRPINSLSPALACIQSLLCWFILHYIFSSLLPLYIYSPTFYTRERYPHNTAFPTPPSSHTISFQPIPLLLTCIVNLYSTICTMNWDSLACQGSRTSGHISEQGILNKALWFFFDAIRSDASQHPSISMQLSVVLNSFRTYICELAEIRLLTESVDIRPFQHCFIDTNQCRANGEKRSSYCFDCLFYTLLFPPPLPQCVGSCSFYQRPSTYSWGIALYSNRLLAI